MKGEKCHRERKTTLLAYSSDRERAFHMIVNSHVMWAAGVDVLR